MVYKGPQDVQMTELYIWGHYVHILHTEYHYVWVDTMYAHRTMQSYRMIW